MIKKIAPIIIILIILTFLVISRSNNKNRFRENVENAVSEIKKGNYAVTSENLGITIKDYKIINLGNENSFDLLTPENSVNISFAELNEPETLQKLKTFSFNCVLYSEDESELAKAWIILNQLGIENLFILINTENDDLLKYNFITDTLKNINP